MKCVDVLDDADQYLFTYSDGFAWRNRDDEELSEVWTVDLRQHRSVSPWRITALDDPWIACLCPTYEKKRGWMELVIEQFQRQTYDNKVLYIVDGNTRGANWALQKLAKWDGFVIYQWRPGWSLARKRNRLLELARDDAASEWFCWFDDDELRDPRWLELVMAAWDGRAEIISPNYIDFLHVETGDVRPYKCPHIMLSSALFQVEPCARVRFPDVVLPKVEDQPWLQELAGRRRLQRLEERYVWQVAHGDNCVNTVEKIFK